MTKLTQKRQFPHYSKNYYSLGVTPGQNSKILVY